MRQTPLKLATALLPFAAVLCAAPLHAQGRGGAAGRAGFARPGFAGAGFARAGLARPVRRHAYNGYGSAFLAAPYFYPDYGPDLLPPEEEPIFVPVQPAPPPAPPAPAAPPAESLLLENRGGQWVRIPTGNNVPAVAEPNAANSTQAAPPEPPAEKLPPAILVFRDGHTEQIDKYTIQGSILFTSANYWATGSWQRKIPLTDLDIPATLKQNADRGGKFTLPTSPNEIVVRF